MRLGYFRCRGSALRSVRRGVRTTLMNSAVRLVMDAVGLRDGSTSESSVRSKITIAALTVGSASFVVKLASLASTLLIASLFGTGDDLEAYFIAFLVPAFIINVISGAVSSAMIPTYVRVTEQQGQTHAYALFSRITFLAIGLLSLVAGLSALTFPYAVRFLGSGFSPAKTALTQSMFYLLLPVIAFKGIATIYASVLHSHKRFALVASAPLVVPAASIVVILSWSTPSTRIYAVALGTVIGMLGELLILGWGLHRHGVPVLPRWHHRSPASRQVIGQYFPMVAGAFLMGSTTLVDQSMAAALPAGSVASLNYGSRLVGVILHIAAGGIGAAVLPFFSSLVDAEDWNELRRLLVFYSKRILLVSSAVSICLVTLSGPLVGFALERGMFDEGDTALVGRIQAAYALQIPFYICGILFVRVISSMIANHILMIVSFLNLIVNIGLNYIFMRRWGVVGIALSTSVVYLFSFAYLLAMVWRKLAERHCRSN